jgi:uncharacterized pyridoxamine 5'-phosphate oxidase family protein
MQDLVKFLNENGSGFLATVDNGRPRVRPFQFMMEEGGRFYFCTNNTKEVFRQLNANPFAEFSSSTVTAPLRWVRLAGQVRFTSDPVIKARVLQKNDLVRSLYKTGDNPIFEVFFIEHGTAAIADFSGNPPEMMTF